MYTPNAGHLDELTQPWPCVCPTTPPGDIGALWTSPFMKGAARLYTVSGGYLTADTGGDGKAPCNSWVWL